MSLFTVLGASGYIGSRLVARLRADGHEVWAPQRGAPDLLSRQLGHVLYCIGLTGDFRSRPFDTVQAHVSLLAQVLEHARFESLLYLSSTRVYLGAADTDEDAVLAVRPHDLSYLYNLSKLAGEALCHACGRSGVRVARLSNVVGPGMDADSGNFIASLLRDARQGHVVLQSDPDSMKDYVYIDDVVDILPCIAQQGRSATYNVASGVQTRHAQWLQWLAEQTGCRTELAPEGPLQQFPPIRVERLRAEFGWQPRAVPGPLAVME